MTDKLDYSRSSGSKGHGGEYDHERPIGHDGRGKIQTTFNPSEATDQERFEKLRKCHDEHTTMSGPERRQADRRRFADTVTAYFDLPSHQRQRVRYIVDRISFDPFSGMGYEVAITALTTLVQNENVDRIQDMLQRRDDYDEFLRDIDATRSGIRQCRVKLRKHLRDIE